MALKETNKNRNKEELRFTEDKPIDSGTCGYVNSLVFGPLIVIGGLLFILNVCILPLL